MNYQIENYINDRITNNPKQTDVIALRPGMGKSQYIIKRMSIALQHNNGLIVVTDSVDRLQEMAKGESIDDDISEYMKRNRDRISLLTSDTFQSEIRTVWYKPVICMTTQRFFRMKPKDINGLISNSKYDIGSILIDEQPSILEIKNIGIKQLTRIDETINAALTNLTDQADKQAIIDSFNTINRSLRQAFKDAEKRNQSGNEASYFYDNNIDGAAETLRTIADKYKSELNAYNSEVFELIETASYIAKDGGMIVSQKMRTKDDANRYNNYISFVKDYREWFAEINSKIVVFDGTGNINPLYWSKHFNVVDCSKIEPKLSELTINIIDTAASKSKLIREPQHLQTIIDYLKSEPERTQAVFVYKETEKPFEEITDSIAHFGNIKGFNKFRELTKITQIGLNRYPNHVYQFLWGHEYLTMQNLPDTSLSDNAIKWYKSQGIKVDEHNKAKGIRTFTNGKYLISYRNQLLLTDIVQNVFRSKIRNQNNHDSVTFNLIFGYSGRYDESIANRMLVQMIEKYFKEKGATVIRVEKPTQIKALEIQRRHSADGTKSKAQLILDWIQSKPSGYVFTPKEAREDLSMNPNDWYSAIHANRNLKSIMDSLRIKHGLYRVS